MGTGYAKFSKVTNKILKFILGIDFIESSLT